MKTTLVVAAAKNGVIGGDGDMPWRIRDDFRWFKKKTLGKPIVMGRKTFQSIGKPLPGRDNIVITRDPAFTAEGVFVVNSIGAGLELAAERAEANGAEEICVIGGGEIYRQTIEQADRIYLTRVDAAPTGDAFFPKLNESEWRETLSGNCVKSEANDHDCEFFTLDRVV